MKIDIGWVEIDDADVRVLHPGEEQVLRRSAYFCLYSAIDVKTSPIQ